MPLLFVTLPEGYAPIDDLAQFPSLAPHSVPHVRVDPYAVSAIEVAYHKGYWFAFVRVDGVRYGRGSRYAYRDVAGADADALERLFRDAVAEVEAREAAEEAEIIGRSVAAPFQFSAESATPPGQRHRPLDVPAEE